MLRAQLIEGVGHEQIEVFVIPTDYMYMEDESGRLVKPGIYFWYVREPGHVPDSYPCGPYESVEEAVDEARTGYSGEP